jgi:hypothetical protein
VSDPVAFQEDFLIYPRLLDLSTCLTEELERRGLPAACWNGVKAGAVPAFDPCACGGGTNGEAYVRLATAFPSTRFPQPVSDARNCIPPVAFQIEVGIIRCYQTNIDAGPLSVSDELDAVRLQMADMADILGAVQCCLGAHDSDPTEMEYLVGTYTPYGPQGGVVGGWWTVYVTQGVRP